jgi:hypothetical protein
LLICEADRNYFIERKPAGNRQAPYWRFHPYCSAALAAWMKPAARHDSATPLFHGRRKLRYYTSGRAEA